MRRHGCASAAARPGLALTDLANIAHKKLLESVWHHVSGLLVGTISDFGHSNLSLETATDTIVNTFWLTPRGINLAVAV